MSPAGPATPVDRLEGGLGTVVNGGPWFMCDSMGSSLPELTLTGYKAFHGITSDDVFAIRGVEHTIGVTILELVLVTSFGVFVADEKRAHLERWGECDMCTLGP